MQAKLIHTMLRTKNPHKCIEFYTEGLGMKLLRTFENEEGKYTLYFFGYKEENESAVIEITYNHGVAEYQAGDIFGHIAIGVSDCVAFIEKARLKNIEVIREPGFLVGGDEFIAFLKDPDGNKIEIIQKDGSWFN